MLRWYFNDRVPVIQINERGRFLGFHDPGMDLIRGHTGLYVAREPDNGPTRSGRSTTAVREPLERVERVWRGTRDGHLCAGKADRLDAGALAAAGFAAVSLARAGGRRQNVAR